MYEFSTGGKGFPKPPGSFRYWADNLESTQPMVAIDTTCGRKYILALNPGDPSFSVIRIKKDLSLELVHKQDLEGYDNV
eukprot:Pgem_evm1s15002